MRILNYLDGAAKVGFLFCAGSRARYARLPGWDLALFSSQPGFELTDSCLNAAAFFLPAPGGVAGWKG
jgi:hypothetical protein